MSSVEDVPGFAPIINTVLQPLPRFMVNYFLGSAPYLILTLATLMSYNDFFRASNQIPSLLFGPREPVETFDFIVVGGGSSGAVVASRLAKNFKVLLLEAGGDPHPTSYIPAFACFLYNKPQVDWGYKTRPLNGSGFGSTSSGGCLNYPRSKSLGGSTNVNDMIYMRGNPSDYDNWAIVTTDRRWSYENVRKYYQKMEDYHGHYSSDEDNDHGVGGPMHIEKAGYTPSIQYWMDAGSELGLKTGSDPNNQQGEGVFQLDVMAKRGVRYGTYRAYLEDNLRFRNRNNNNLVVHRYSIVTQIHFDENKTATGVTYFRHAIKQQARASKEIILTAGAINTPKLLLLSGIGPKEELESVGIEQIADLPVGKNNLQDHVSTLVGPFLLNKSESFLASRDVTTIAAASYLSQGIGPFSVTNFVSAAGLFSTSSALPLWPNILYTMMAAGTDRILQNHLMYQFSLNRQNLESFLQNNLGKDSNYVVVTLGKPRSRGSVRIPSFDPWHEPHIDLNYYSDEGDRDMNDMIEGIKMAVNLYENTTSFQKLGAHLAPEQYPGCEQHEMRSDAYWDCLIRTVTVTLSNPCCTAPMGLKDSPQAVVDSELRVIGVKGLRIADASVMPEITNAHLNAVPIMIGEVASDLIIHDHPGRT
ncbi:Oxygen-dependent choline dehydrogenase [Orchesella cincta]|uniref:Oxygen-dependent choline dehydrogenase n=1 Tax=Orchesella cincta TaxID=48709 RepID=A0A1D2MWA8_ORCCI|nr:Oxygen-dependent choline dehydrogenase [Orchesella cincta]